MRASSDPTETRATEIDEILADAHLVGLAERHPLRLSGGQRQRLAVVTALAARPAFALLDEPTSSQDARGAATVIDLIRCGARDRVTLIATHDDVFDDIATHRIELLRGRVTGIRERTG